MLRNCKSLPLLLAAFVLALAAAGYAQNDSSPLQNQSIADIVQVPAGEKISIEGVVLENRQEDLFVRGLGGGVYRVAADNAEIKERKSNPFRGARKYAKSDLVAGLLVEVKGVGSESGAISAREIKCTNDDFKVAQTMNNRVVPVENRLSATQTRLSETEQNARRLSGQVQELSAVSNAARGGAKAAQETADNAMLAANGARTAADDAKAGVQAANQRIASLDDYDVKHTAIVHFKVGSAVIAKEEMEELEQLAETAKNEKGFVIEVAGFASSDGDLAYNRRLSQKRADAVIQHLAENHSIPLRRFVMPMGLGESQPVADNQTREGRGENRRVEVRVLVSKGLIAPETRPATDGTLNVSSLSRGQ